jgi:Calcineurin-like phosphoesterase
MAYDIIGDIHGQVDKLEALLRTLGYRDTAGAWRHAERQAIFVGDFIDRGPAQVRSVHIVRRMVDAGAALAVMGNHELNAIAWHTPDPRHPGQYLRSHDSAKWGEKNRKQHAAFLAEVEDAPSLHAEIIDWFLTPPPLAGSTRVTGGACVLASSIHGMARAASARGQIPHEGSDGPSDRRAGE